ncbi:T9SS type A sorting domain-containing protein [uncultured Winogradskyella sp.]|uniref:T9SS type A sorting domain-containing protein n=1 Tax=uncultured Winogradskyella sp. TaxID=395353 RepID=UPI0030DADCF8|tara:strand:- start:995 stop:2758 length:1764 start_codon:yes stop_codon:yes gene_type:complete
MKKIYFLLFTLMFGAFSFAQTTLFQDSFETGSPDTLGTMSEMCTDGAGDFFTVTDGTNIGGNYAVSGADGTFWLAAQDTDGAPECNSATQTLEYDNIDISAGTDMTLAFTVAEDDDGTNQDWDADTLVYLEIDVDNSGTYTKIYQFAATGGTNTEPGVDTNFDGTADGALLSNLFQEFTAAVPNGSTLDLRITFEKLNAGDEDISIDNIRVIDGYVTSPEITITSPADATVFAPGTTNVDVEFSTANLNGGETVSITVNGNTTNNATSPFSIPTTDGTAYDVTVDLVDGGVLDTDMISFSVGSLITVADITALRADVVANGLGRFYEITGSSLVTHTDGFRNRKWIQDTDISGVLIYDDANVIATTYNVGDLVSGLRGTTTDSNGVLRFVPTSDSGVIASSGNSVVPQTVTIADLNASPNDYESELVELQNVIFTDGDGTATFATGQNYDVTDGTNTIVKRTDFFGADYIGEIIPSTQVPSVVAVAGEFNGAAQIYVRTLNDFTLSTSNFETSSFLLYPNPTSTGSITITSVSNDTISVKVYDILGKQVKNETLTNNTLNVSNLKSGIYIIKITQNNTSTTKKLVIK